MSKVFAIELGGELRCYVIAEDGPKALEAARLFGVLGDGDYAAVEADADKADIAINAERN